MQYDAQNKLAPLTVFFHWTIAVMVIGALSFGFYIHELPRSPEKAALLYIHKNVGVIMFLLAISRIIWRWTNGLLPPARPLKPWEARSSRFIHILLIVGTILMPISGVMFTLGYACSSCTVPIFWITEIGPLPEKITWIAVTGQRLHGIAAYILAGALLLHTAAALKHHYWDRDPTLRRMLGKSI